MTIDANWKISGIKFENSANAFVTSAQIATSTSTLKKHQNTLNKNFKQYIQDNMLRAGMDADNLHDVFSMEINGNGINFINTEPLITQRYEYGYYEEYPKDKNNNEDEYYEEYISLIISNSNIKKLNNENYISSDIIKFMKKFVCKHKENINIDALNQYIVSEKNNFPN